MSKKKANICTLLLMIIVLFVWIGSYFLKTADGIFRLQYAINVWMAIFFMMDCFIKFRNWLME